MDKYIDLLRKCMIESGEDTIDIDDAVNYAENLLNLKMPVIFDMRHLEIQMGLSKNDLDSYIWTIDRLYKEIIIKKKSGKDRKINAPSVGLKVIQKWILDNILKKISVSDYAMGFVAEKSIVDNAKIHVNADCVVNIDMLDFFPSITEEQVFRFFYYFGYTEQVSYYLTKLTTLDGYLPQGATTSPYISNIVCLKLDKRLNKLAFKYNARYSRYADDITFSGKFGIQNIINVARMIIEDEGFYLNPTKTRVLFNYQRQEVTGLVVSNGKVRVKKEYLKKFKQSIYYCKKFGVTDHLKYRNISKLFYRDHMYGKAYFIKMVNTELGNKLLDELDQVNWEGS